VVSCVQRWYPRRRGFAAGIAAGAFGFSVVLLSPVAEALIALVGLPGAFRILGAVFLIVTLAASRLVSDPPENPAPTEGAAAASAGRNGPGAAVSDGVSGSAGISAPGPRQWRPREVLASPVFWCFFLSLFLEVAAWVVILPVIKTMALARGMSRELALAAVMVTGIANASGRILSAWVSDRIGRTRTVIALCLVTCGASLWLVGAVGIPYVIAVFLVAFAYGGPSGVFPPLVREVFGQKHAGTNFGMVLMALGFSSLVFSRISGALSAGAASSGDYSASFYLTAALGAAAAVFMLAAGRMGGRK
jgi:OFA family oxalate/formate antiporter-like MFS transporter